MSDIQAQLLIAEYKKAYRLANKREPPCITYSRGWFKIRYSFAAIGTKHRRSEIEKFRDTLKARPPVAEKERTK